ncbi:N-acetylglucosaminyl-phosphatidylinositol biosynthetic protein gpi1 isoform X2 [Cannabis sativa]|uniref:N-acetylglucosaminyl-phosphatidylinositol biosynthetic protein gpi1 isoform X2 n=1 Tax=Cannabis sativa TaxID=3483 RepID=UPI0029C9D0F9|nr:N-acetylglucosaminyl-phosphatidylinositol biosynthetic protein gpi1 isoform X2 [Cannabis sativa]
MKRKCRVWWPKELSLNTTSSSTKSFLFGWFVSSSCNYLDVVVAFATSDASLSGLESEFEGILHETNEKMPMSLQDKSELSLLGHFAVGVSNNGELSRVGMGEDDELKSGPGFNGNNSGQWSCECHKLDRLVERDRPISKGNSWIQVVAYSREKFGRDIFRIPKLHHIHWNGQIVSHCDVHYIFYETPAYGSHHFSSHSWSSYEQVKAPLRKPKWVEKLHQKQPLCDLDTTILAINCATAAKVLFSRHLDAKRSVSWLLSYTSSSWIYITSTKVFHTAGLNIRIRCSQILYWPIFLQDRGIRSLSCVEYAEKAALQRHSLWSSLATDIFLGNLIGFVLLFHAESASFWVLNFADDITNNLLRSGCVWLMGVPAGFKLNTELAAVLGMISLNAVQIWSTLWIFMGFDVTFLVKTLGILSIIFGVTLPAALIIDLITLATLHVSTIHCVISLLYSTQIQAIASLWRLFRGQKWNPLRMRLDSYNYTVKQHIVGSLLFTPLLLLLPTTTVFYIFFSILDTTISLVCMLTGVAISVIHATPYVKVFLRLVQPRRFPSGIWFDIVSSQCDTSDPSERVDFSSENLQMKKDITKEKTSSMISFLHSNFMTLGQVILPHYKNIFSGISRSSIAASAYGILTGKRMGSTMLADLPSPMPWMFIPYKQYWFLCRDSILAMSS